MIVLEGLRFQLIMYHPFRPLTGFIDDMRAYYKSKSRHAVDIAIPTLQHLHASATNIIHELLLTDAPLLCSPACIALAGTRMMVVMTTMVTNTENMIFKCGHILSIYRSITIDR
jgi:cyclin H